MNAPERSPARSNRFAREAYFSQSNGGFGAYSGPYPGPPLYARYSPNCDLLESGQADWVLTLG